MKLAVAFFGVVTVTLLTLAMIFTAGWTHPPIVAEQIGFRGLGMEQVSTPSAVDRLKAANALPDPIPTASPAGPKATEVYKNVQVLTDLSAEQFNTVMAAITAWVAPQQGCAYCHNVENMADDGVYAKKVARRMIQMTRHLNTDWKSHVQNTGVVCWTCHRGNPVPQYTWYENEGWPQAGGFATTNYGFGHPSWANDSSSLLQDPYTPLDTKDPVIRVQATQPLPVSSNGAPILNTEKTYALMISISRALGVNCTYCHNSREWAQWSESTPQRAVAWYGIRMADDINLNWVGPLKDTLPPAHLGPHGQAPLLNCATCHQGAAKPLLGVSIAKDWPELGGTPAK